MVVMGGNGIDKAVQVTEDGERTEGWMIGPARTTRKNAARRIGTVRVTVTIVVGPDVRFGIVVTISMADYGGVFG